MAHKYGSEAKDVDIEGVIAGWLVCAATVVVDEDAVASCESMLNVSRGNQKSWTEDVLAH